MHRWHGWAPATSGDYGATARILRHAGTVQDVAHARTFPARVTHRAVAPFDAGDMRLRQPAAIARALAHRRDLDRFEVALQSVRRQPIRSMDRSPPMPGAILAR